MWEDDSGTVHLVRQGEGGEPGGALMSLLFSLFQYGALQAAQEQLQPQERLMAFLDDVYMVSQPERVGGVYAVLQTYRPRWDQGAWGKDQGVEHGWSSTVSCDVLEQSGRNEDPRAVFFSRLDFREQGIKILGIPVWASRLRHSLFGTEVSRARDIA